MTDQLAARALLRDESSVGLDDGAVLPISEAIDRLPWVTAHCPTMPHQYVVSSWSDCDPDALAAILAMLRESSRVVPAYWRGYRTPTRYWHGPAGFRYWISAGLFPERGDTVLNRTDEVDETRPVANGATPISDWQGAPFAPSGSGNYERPDGLDGWWPTAEAIGSGFKPCRACRRKPQFWTEDEKRVLGDAYDIATFRPTR